MRIGRPYIAVLCLAVVALAVYLVVPKGATKSPPARSEAQLHSLELAALGQLRLPRQFVPLRKGCTVERCYVIDRPATEVAAMMPGLLRADGFEPLGRLKAAEPVAMLRLAHWSTASSDPLVVACRRVSVSGAPLTMCQDAGRVGQTLVNVLASPYQPCHKPSCTDARRTEVQAWSTAFPLS